MRYVGGKFRQGPAIAAAAMARHSPGALYYEPFAGGFGSAFRAVPLIHANGGSSCLSDGSEALATMWLAAMAGWEPPEHVDRETYDRVRKARDPRDPMTAFCGYGLSFGAMWFASYVDKPNYARSSRNSIRRKLAAMAGCRYTFRHVDYREVRPDAGSVVYLDPPYAGRGKNHGDTGSFDSAAFWDHARDLVRRGCRVIATEFVAPADWRPIFSWGDTISRPAGNAAVNVVDERIFVHEDQYAGDLV